MLTGNRSWFLHIESERAGPLKPEALELHEVSRNWLSQLMADQLLWLNDDVA
jgi:hypothetical protein